MHNILIFLTLFIFFNTSLQCTEGMIFGEFYDWSEISNDEQEKVKNSIDNYFELIINNKPKELWGLCHEEFQKIAPIETFPNFTNVLSGLIKSKKDLTFIDCKKSKYDKEPNQMSIAFGGSIDEEKPKYLKYSPIPGIKEQFIVLYHLKGEKLNRTIVVMLGKENDDLKMTSMYLYINSQNGKDSDYYLNVVEKLKGDIDLQNILFLNMAYQLSTLGSSVSSKKSIEIMKKITDALQDSVVLDNILNWKIKDSVYDVFRMDFIETLNDITPNFNYVTKSDLSEEKTNEECDLLIEYLKEDFPELIKEFKTFSFTAYKQKPLNPYKQYKYFRVIKEL
jgi:uncharacterized protein YejL (UPF0352 family)